jgi:hypothetical protein
LLNERLDIGGISKHDMDGIVKMVSLEHVPSVIGPHITEVENNTLKHADMAPSWNPYKCVRQSGKSPAW